MLSRNQAFKLDPDYLVPFAVMHAICPLRLILGVGCPELTSNALNP